MTQILAIEFDVSLIFLSESKVTIEIQQNISQIRIIRG